MKSILLKMLAIVGVLFVTSCSSDDEESTLNLSKTRVEFSRSTGTQKVSVDTNVDSWTAMASGAEWVKASGSGSSLVIKVEENTTIHSRTAEVLVFAGEATAKLEVKQKGAEGSAVVTPESLELNENQGETVFEVEANDDNWTVETDADWLTLTQNKRRGEVKVVYADNKTSTARTAKILVKVGNSIVEVNVTQSGSLLYFLPYLEFDGATKDAIKQFEEGRGSKFEKDLSGGASLTFSTSSKVFNKLVYLVTDKYEVVFVDAIDLNTFYSYAEGFYKFLKEKGFTEIYADDYDIEMYFNEEKRIRATIDTNYKANTASIKYEYIPKQTGSYTTFKKLPTLPVEWGASKVDVETYEASNGGTLKEEKEDNVGGYYFVEYNVSNSSEEGDVFYRQYNIAKADSQYYKAGFGYIERHMRNYELAFFQTSDSRYVLTEEFMKLCEKQGYKYKGKVQQFDIFINTAKNTVIKVGAGPDADGNGYLKFIMDRLDRDKGK